MSDDAKERARGWYRTTSVDTNDFECVIDDFVAVGGIIGIDFDTREGREPNISWSVGYCQGDYAAFEGVYDYKATAPAKIREHCGDGELIRIADELAAIQIRNGFGLRVKVERNGDQIDYWDRRDDMRDTGKDGSDAGELMRDLMRWLYRALRDQSDYMFSDGAVDESIEANDYKFTKEGRRHEFA